MNNKSTKIIVLFFSIIISSCEKVQKDVNDYYPEVRTNSATVLSDGSVEVEGEIINNGTTDLAYLGFCMDTLDNPEMLKNQQMVTSIYGNKFYVIYSDFDPYKRYFFRAWAANDKGYAYGNTVNLDSIQATPVVPPCTPSNNTLNIGGGQPVQYFSTVGSPVLGVDGWEVTANTSGGTYYFTFGSKPTTNIYTVASSTLGTDNVKMYFYSGFITGALKTGAQVYVNQTNASHWVITLCNAPWLQSSTTFNMTGKFDCPK